MLRLHTTVLLHVAAVLSRSALRRILEMRAFATAVAEGRYDLSDPSQMVTDLTAQMNQWHILHALAEEYEAAAPTHSFPHLNQVRRVMDNILVQLCTRFRDELQRLLLAALDDPPPHRRLLETVGYVEACVT